MCRYMPTAIFSLGVYLQMAEKSQPKYSKDNLCAAVKAVLNEGYTTHQMCEKFKIPMRTLQYNVK